MMITIKAKDRPLLFSKYRNSNLFIEAGAGAGKTQFISDKTSDLISQGVPVDEIILITFTNKAAEEMLSRISSDLDKKIDNESNIENKNKLIIAKNNLYRLNVSTIHSFCNKLLNENSFLAKLPYNFTLLDEDDESERRDELFSRWYNTLTTNDFNDINKLAFSKNKKFDIKNKYLNLCQYFPNQEINESVPSDDEYYRYLLNINDIYHLLMEYRTSLSSKYNSQAIKFIDEYESFINDIGDITLSTIPTYLSSFSKIERLKQLISKYNGSIKLNKINNDKDPINVIKDGEDFNNKFTPLKAIKDAKERMNTYQYKYINIYAKRAFKYYNDNCEKDKLSNNQLIFYTYQLLIDKSSSKVRDTLASRYNSIFVDEFQDTDKYQIKFIDELVKAISNRKKKYNNNTTTLIVVGDPKQSIYRFRGADINSFINYRDDTSLDKQTIYLPDNFRSNNYIIDYLNTTYSSKDKSFHPSYTYENMLVASNNDINKELISLIKKDDNVLSGVYSYIFNYEYFFNELKKKEEVTSELIIKDYDNKFVRLVKLVKYLVENKYKIYKSIDKKLGLYEVTYSDFLILTHSKSEINEYVKTFNKYQININVAGEYNLTSSILFNLVCSLLEYLLDPSLNNLLDIKSKINISNDDEFNEYINDLVSITNDMTPYGKLMYVLNTLFNQSFIIKDFIKADISTYDTVIHQIMEIVNINNDVDSIHLLNELNKLRETPQEQQLNISNNNECVRIMNMHKSKGLEGNIVIVPDSGSSKSRTTSLLFDDVVYMSANNFSKVIKDRNDSESNEERLRLEYVVASRAKSVLIFERVFDKRSKIFSSDNYSFEPKYLKQFELNNTRLPTNEEIDTYFPNNKDNLDTYYQISSNKQFKLDNYKDIVTPTINSFSPSNKEVREEISISDKRINRPKNNIFGDCLHKGMELLVSNYSIDIDKLSSQVVNLYLEDIPSKEVDNYIKYLSKCIKAIKSLYDKESILKDYDSYPEYKFTTFIKEDNALINGSIDLFLIKDNHIKIIDYKSDISGFKDVESFNKILINRYKPQLEFYKKVINNMFKDYIIETSIIYVEEDDENEIAHQIII